MAGMIRYPEEYNPRTKKLLYRIRCIGLTRKLFMIFKTQENIITVLSEQIM